MLILSMRAEPEMILALFAFYALGAGGIDIEPPSGGLCEVILSNINFARYQEIPESRLHLLLFFSHPTVVITGCDEPEQFSGNLFDYRHCIASPVDYLVGPQCSLFFM